MKRIWLIKKLITKNNIALIEIVFNARNEENVPYYRIEDDEEEDALRTMLLDILKTGQQNGVFSDSFQTDTLASFIFRSNRRKNAEGKFIYIHRKLLR